MLVATVTGVQLLPATFLTPTLMVFADRVAHRERVLQVLVVMQTGLLVAATIAIRLDLGRLPIIAPSALALSMGTLFRPLGSDSSRGWHGRRASSSPPTARPRLRRTQVRWLDR